MQVILETQVTLNDRTFFPGVANVPDDLGKQLIEAGASPSVDGQSVKDAKQAETTGRVKAAAEQLAPLLDIAPEEATAAPEHVAALLESAVSTLAQQQTEADKLHKQVDDLTKKIADLEKQLTEAKKKQS